MKNKLFLLLSIFTLAIAGCSTNASSEEETKIEAFLDKPSFTYNEIDFNFTELSETQITNYSVRFGLELTNKNPKPKEFMLDDAKIIRESNEAEYSVGGYYINKFDLECDIKESTHFSSTLPTSCKEDKYTFQFTYDSKTILYHLYKRPAELREKVNLTYVVDGEVVETRKIPAYDTFYEHLWFSSDYVYGCDKWYSDSNKHSLIVSDFEIKEDTTVYGEKKSVLKYNLPNGISSSFVSGVNFIPLSGEIVVPKSFEGKAVYSILAGSFSGANRGLTAVYIPKTVRISDYKNFSDCADLKYVYFEGTESEWGTINEASYPSTTKIVYNTYK